MKPQSKQRADESRAAAQSRRDFLGEHPVCWTCRQIATEIHELTPGAGRRRGLQERCTWLATCSQCHREKLQPFTGQFTLAGQLAIKAVHDPDYYDRLRVLEIKGMAPTAVTEIEVLLALKLWNWH